MTEQHQRENGAMQQGSPAMPAQQVQQPRPAPVQRVPTAQYLGAINAAIEIAAIRVLGLLALLGALALFAFAMYDSTTLRMYTAIAYAFVVLWPMVYMYLSKGRPD